MGRPDVVCWMCRFRSYCRDGRRRGGEAQLTAFQDMAVTRPVFQPTPRSVVERSDEVGVSAVVVDATRRAVDCTKSTISDSTYVVAEEMQNGMDGCVDFAGGVPS